MGAKMLGLRTAQNDNRPRPKGETTEVPISPEEWRHAPVIQTEAGVRWYCLVTAPQGEYRCATGLSDAGVASYVPTSTQWVKRRKGRELLKTQTQMPIFRGYVFVRIASDRDWEPVYATERKQADFPPQHPDEDPYVATLRTAAARSTSRRSPIGILGVIGVAGVPVPIPLRQTAMRDGQIIRCGVADFADDEREGWFDDTRRPALVAGRDIKPEPEIMAGERVRFAAGPFAGVTADAVNDNERGLVRLRVQILGGETLMTVPIEDLENLTRPRKNDVVGLRRA